MVETFGLRVPAGALKTILKRVVKRGYAERTEGIYLRNKDALAALNLSKARGDALREHEALVSKLVDFCRSRYQIAWSREDAEAALLMYIKDRSMPILTAAVEGGPVLGPERWARHAEFLVNSFIGHLCNEDSEGFELLETVVKGSMLANVLFFPVLGEVKRRFARMDAYFDTPFLLRVLGLATPSVQAPCRELADLLYELNVSLRCFERTVQEVRGILTAVARALEDPRSRRSAYGEAFEYCVSVKYRASDIEYVIARLEDRLRRLHISIERVPPYEEALGVDEEELEQALRKGVRYQRDEALGHDLAALTAIHRLRGGRFPDQIESCDAVFVTTNPRLAEASASFFRQEYGDAAIAVPHCIMDHLLTAIAWLKKPLGAPELPRKRIIADCYAAMNPPDTLWRQYLEEAHRVLEQGDISEDDYNVLRFSMEARRLLMDVTLGDPGAFTDGTVQEVLERAKATVRAETEARLRAERERRIEAEQRAAELQVRAETRHGAQVERCQTVAARVGVWVRAGVIVGIIGVVALATYVTFPKPFPELREGWWRLIAPVLLVVLGMASVLNLVFGTALVSLARRAELRASRVVERELLRLVTG
jgi:hypothetical protein